MTSRDYTEDQLVQKTVADYFEEKLGWNSVFAFNEEVLGPDGTLGRFSEREIVLRRYLRQTLEELNPGLPEAAFETAISQITEISLAKTAIQTNKEKYELFREGIVVSYKGDKGKIQKARLQVFNFKEPEKNHFLVVRELWVKGSLYRRRPDIIGFVNGIPLLFIELKNVHKDIERAYNENLSDYKDTIPRIFDHNAFIVLSNGDKSRIGSLSAKYEYFHEWKRLEEEDPSAVDMETMLKGICSKKNFMDLFENFTVFDDSKGKMEKIIARNHQFLGVNRAVQAVEKRKERKGQLGVFWHTQGAGKSYSMVFFSRKVHRKLHGDFTFLILTDREDLDDQIYKTFAGTGAVKDKKCRAGSGKHLEKLLRTDLGYIFTMIHKFNQDVDPEAPYSSRDDIIVISDEAHRTQYGRLALNMRNALPNANFIGFTGTPLFKDDEITKRIFGEYVSTYDFQRAVEDEATVPLKYDNRGEKLHLSTTDINEKLAEKLEETDLDPDQQARLEKELAREYHIITAEKRLDAIAKDFVRHYTTNWETGKAMFICIDKITTVRMYDLIQRYWQEHIKGVEAQLKKAGGDQEEIGLHHHLEWLKSTIMAVIVSEEQGEVKKFKEWGVDIKPHRRLIKKGFETTDGKRKEVDEAFKDPEHPFRIAIVCAMWLTGFDVPSLSTLYLDKPLKAHTLMQAIARANRVHEGKNNGLIVDYCGILKNLRRALATFAVGGPGGGEIDPVKPQEELIGELEEAIGLVRTSLSESGYSLDKVIQPSGFERIAAINEAKEVINVNDETRKRFEIQARAVFKKFKACLTIETINDYRLDHDAIDIIYKKLQDDRAHADITAIIKELHSIVDEVIEPSEVAPEDKDKVYDISKIDFDKLRAEFQRSNKKNTTVQSLKEAVENRLQIMIQKNPLRMDYYQRYQEIIADYNREKDRVTIEQTFEALMKFVKSLDQEEKRSIREGLDEEKLALFDLLLKPDLSTRDRNRIKKVAQDLLDALKREKLKIDNWRDKESTRADVKTFILNFLWDEQKGLPVDVFSEREVEETATRVFDHVFNQYPDAQHHAYI